MTAGPAPTTSPRQTAASGQAGGLTVEAARRLAESRQRELGVQPEPVAAVTRIDVPTRSGSVPAIVYHPAEGVRPGLVIYLHGGGWVAGSPDLFDSQARALANASGWVLLSAAYRLAPENPYPAALEDAYDVLCWAAGHGHELGARPGVVVMGGVSAGANLAAGACLMARDHGAPRVTGQLLIYPATVRDLDTPSRREFAVGYGLTLAELQWFWEQYLPASRAHIAPYASPLNHDLAGLPPAVVLTAEQDVLRDEGEEYARRLREAGVTVTARRWSGVPHGFLGSGTPSVVRPALAWVARALNDIMHEARSRDNRDGRR